MSKCEGQLYIHRVEHVSRKVGATLEGNVKVSEKEELIDIYDTWLACEKHGRLSTDEFEFHGVADAWEEE